MSLFNTYQQQFEFNRGRTLGLLDRIEQMPELQAVLGWRPGPGRAHIGWQLMHIGVTEEIFAVERLATKEGRFQQLWDRFKGGSTPDDDVPTIAQIRDVLAAGRDALLTTLSEVDEAKLDEIAWEARDGRRLTLRATLQILNWHEAHHQGQAHITLNLYDAAIGGYNE
ncbi:MAG: DinB family protein [Planctomycetes bacterium]|nr:DinB family protein [Planctomycetota bacterium]